MKIKVYILERINALNRKVLYGVSSVVFMVLLVIVYLISGEGKRHANQPLVEAPVAVTTITVEPRTINAQASAAGSLASKNSSVLSSKVMGRVAELTVNEGDYVPQGKLLLKIESGEISAQSYQAQAAYNNAKIQYGRIKSLYDNEAATRMEMDQATLGLETAEAGLKAAKAMESYTTITAPIPGRIVEKKINLGEMALPGQALFKIEDNRNLRLEVTVREQDLRYIQSGKPVTVQIDAIPGKEIKALVGQVVPAADIRTHSFVVKIDIPAVEKGLITGMYGKAFFSTGKREAILVPRAAVMEMSGLSGVYLVSSEGNAVFQMVQVGEAQGDSIEALTGLKAGDRVIVNHHDTPIEGRKVVMAENGK